MEAPVIEDLRRRAGRFGLDIVMINVWESVDAAREARQFCDIHGVDGTVLLDEDGGYAAALQVPGVPFNLVVDADGTVRAAGVSTPGELRAAVSALLERDDW